MHDQTGNLPPLPGVFPDLPGANRQQLHRWPRAEYGRVGHASPVFALAGKKSDPGVTNIRNVKSPHRRRWLGVESRCVVPFTSFSEFEVQPDESRPPPWFALDETRPLAFFAGIWARWTSVRKVREGETTNDLFGFPTTEPNADVAPVHPKAMPVILRTREEIDVWLNAPTPEALTLQKPLPDGTLRIVARCSRRIGCRSRRPEVADLLPSRTQFPHPWPGRTKVDIPTIRLESACAPYWRVRARLAVIPWKHRAHTNS